MWRVDYQQRFPVGLMLSLCVKSPLGAPGLISWCLRVSRCSHDVQQPRVAEYRGSAKTWRLRAPYVYSRRSGGAYIIGTDSFNCRKSLLSEGCCTEQHPMDVNSPHTRGHVGLPSSIVSSQSPKRGKT